MTPDREERVICAPEDRRRAVLDVIGSAHERLILSVFRCDDRPIIDALDKAVRRGVQVRVLMTGRARGSKKHLKRLKNVLEDCGADVRTYADPVVRYHAKYIVADDGPVLVASLNFTGKCFETTCDFILVSYDPNLVEGVTLLFEADWRAPNDRLPSLPTDRMIVGPELARDQLAALLQQAARSIRLIDAKVSDPTMLTLLKARLDEGITVDLRGEEGLGPLMPHGKLLLIDDSIAVIGSISLTTLALEFRRELGVLVRDPRALRDLDEFWQSLPPQPGGTPAPLPAGESVI
jgi:phosphatidylserine/phosphatidylglycerophosphate/cardiolipin synthase-like enzyme